MVDDDDKKFILGFCATVAVFLSAVFAIAFYSARFHQECVLANMQRSAGDVIAICGHP